MRKFLLILVLVLCMALPAAAATWTVTSADALKTAVASADIGDTIVIAGNISLPMSTSSAGNYGLYISSDKTLTLQISDGCELSATNCACILSSGNLTIEGSGKITTSADGSEPAVAVCASSGSVTIGGNVTLSADHTGGETAHGVRAFSGSSVTIKDNVSIYAHSNCTDPNISPASRAVSALGTGTVNILGGTVVEGVLKTEGIGTINVYAGTFSDSAVSDDTYLGPDSSCTQSDDKYVVTNNAEIIFNSDLSFAQGASGDNATVPVALKVSGGKALGEFDELNVTPASFDGITATPSSADGNITFDIASDCTPGPYTFSVSCTAPSDTTKPHLQTKDLIVTVVKSGSEPEPSSSGSASNGGCNAGFAGLALAAFALLAAKRKK